MSRRRRRRLVDYRLKPTDYDADRKSDRDRFRFFGGSGYNLIIKKLLSLLRIIYLLSYLLIILYTVNSDSF